MRPSLHYEIVYTDAEGWNDACRFECRSGAYNMELGDTLVLTADDFLIEPFPAGEISIVLEGDDIVSAEGMTLTAVQPGDGTAYAAFGSLKTAISIHVYRQLESFEISAPAYVQAGSTFTVKILNKQPADTGEEFIWQQDNGPAIRAQGLTYTFTVPPEGYKTNVRVTAVSGGYTCTRDIYTYTSISLPYTGGNARKAIVGSIVDIYVKTDEYVQKNRSDLYDSIVIPDSAKGLIEVAENGGIRVIGAGRAAFSITCVDGKVANYLIVSHEASDSFRIPAGIVSIEDEAFAGIAAEKVVIPAGCVSIGSRAFAGSAVQIVNIPDSVIAIAWDAFSECNVTVYCPAGSYVESWCAAHYVNCVAE